MTINRSDAPWTDEEVINLNDFQTMSGMHPFTCRNSSSHGPGYLRATSTGWMCDEEKCDYVQTWAHKEMTDGSWREWESARRGDYLTHKDNSADWDRPLLPSRPVMLVHTEDPPGSGLSSCFGEPFQNPHDDEWPKVARVMCPGCMVRLMSR